MSNITMQLPDELVTQAKNSGVFNEQAISNVIKQFLQKQIGNAQTMNTLQANNLQQINNEKTWQDYFSSRDLSAIPHGFMNSRQQPEIQNRNLFTNELEEVC